MTSYIPSIDDVESFLEKIEKHVFLKKKQSKSMMMSGITVYRDTISKLLASSGAVLLTTKIADAHIGEELTIFNDMDVYPLGEPRLDVITVAIENLETMKIKKKNGKGYTTSNGKHFIIDEQLESIHKVLCHRLSYDTTWVWLKVGTVSETPSLTVNPFTFKMVTTNGKIGKYIVGGFVTGLFLFDVCIRMKMLNPGWSYRFHDHWQGLHSARPGEKSLPIDGLYKELKNFIVSNGIMVHGELVETQRNKFFKFQPQNNARWDSIYETYKNRDSKDTLNY